MTQEKDVSVTGKLPSLKSKLNAAKPVAYNVIAGFNFDCKTPEDEGTRVEPGLLTITLPPKVLTDLLAQGVIVEVTDDGR